MRVVVTGASGFLGTCVQRRLHQGEDDVVGVSRSSVTNPFMVQVLDYSDSPQGDILIHLAETRDRAVAEELGQRYVSQTTETLKALLEKGYRQIVYASSAVVYGDCTSQPHQVDDPVYAADIYAQAKLAGEELVREAGGLIARLANLYGPGMAEMNVLSTILNQIPGQGPLEVRDDQPLRDFLWVEDAAEALFLMSQSTRSGTYNVGSGTGTTIANMAKLSLELAGEGQRDVIARLPSTRASCNVLDISRSVRDFGWRPKTSLADGIQELLIFKDRCRDAT